MCMLPEADLKYIKQMLTELKQKSINSLSWQNTFILVIEGSNRQKVTFKHSQEFNKAINKFNL